MKKVININFKGRVIPIEETAFEQLQLYIESLRRYFVNEEGRNEIINDIEDRIAELFDEELKKGAPCITDESVNTILNSMGRIEDFQQMDSEPSVASAGASSGAYTATIEEPRGSISRNANDKVLGGVCSGIAHYLKIDPTVVRILFALITLGGFGAGVLIYIVLWILLPVRELKSNVKKRLFRNPDDKVIGGVASGLAKYFNIAVWVPRLVFLLPFVVGFIPSVFDFSPAPFFFTTGFGGTLFMAYIILWIILPIASTATDKLQMRGEKVDIGSISKAIKEDLKKTGEDVKANVKHVSEEMKEGVLGIGGEVKERTQAFMSEAKPIVHNTGSSIGNTIGILFKAFFLFFAGIIAFCLLMALFGITISSIVTWPIKDYFFEGSVQNFSVWGTLIFFLLVPAVAFFVWIIRKIFSIKSKNSYLGYVFGGLWMIGWVCFIMLAIGITKNFSNRTKITETVSITQPVKAKMLVTVSEPEVNYSGHYWWLHDGNNGSGWDIDDDSLKLGIIRMQIEQSNDSAYSVQIERRSYGSSRQNAIAKAEKIAYHVTYKDSVLDLGSYMAIAKKDKFRGQQVNVVIKVPLGKKIRFDRSFKSKLNTINTRITRKRRWNDFDKDWEVDVYPDFEYASDVDYVMTVDGLRRVDGKDNQKYDHKKDEDKDSEDIKEEIKQIEEQKEELRKKEERLRQQQQADTTRSNYQQPGGQKTPEKAVREIAEQKTDDAVIYKPITVSAL